MGISGLLPFLKKASKEGNIKDFKGCTVAIDSYCWLHKGAFSCAEKLALGEPTDQYVYYCMKYVNSLLSFGIKPILVFDGCRLPSKASVEKQRRERREANRKKAAQLLRDGHRSEARECLQRCVDVTSQMALELMNACRDKGVDCIVAPYEADAQLAFLSKTGIAQVVITEDSDLVLFGCERIMFKMDFTGNGVLIEKSELNKAMELRPEHYTFDKFRYMCIMSGCDYLASLPGIGLANACKVFKLTRQTDMTLVLKKLPTTLKKSNLTVSREYIEGFNKAVNTFLYQLVFDPRTRKQVPLNAYPDDVNCKDLEYAGPYMDEKLAFQIALGNIDIYTKEQISFFDPDTHVPKYKKKSEVHGASGKEMLHMLSIWNKSYRPMPKIGIPGGTSASTKVDRPSTKGKQTTVSLKLPVNKSIATKRARDEQEDENRERELNFDLAMSYQSGDSIASSPSSKRRRSDIFPESELDFDKCDKTEEEGNDTEVEAHSSLDDSLNDDRVDNSNSPNMKSDPSPSVRNKFAVRSKLNKDKFDLNAQKETNTEQISRFFKDKVPSIKKPVPQTDFFSSLVQHHPEKLFEKDIKTTSNDEEEDETDKCSNAEVTDVESQSYKPSLKTSISSGGHKSPFQSFGFKALDKFKSKFDRQSPVSSQFKPVQPSLKKESSSVNPFGLSKSQSSCIGSMDSESGNLSSSPVTVSDESESDSQDPTLSPVFTRTNKSAGKSSENLLKAKSLADTLDNAKVQDDVKECDENQLPKSSHVGLKERLPQLPKPPNCDSLMKTPGSSQQKDKGNLGKSTGKSKTIGACRPSGLSKRKSSAGKSAATSGTQVTLSRFFSKFSYEKPSEKLSRDPLKVSPNEDNIMATPELSSEFTDGTTAAQRKLNL